MGGGVSCEELSETSESSETSELSETSESSEPSESSESSETSEPTTMQLQLEYSNRKDYSLLSKIKSELVRNVKERF